MTLRGDSSQTMDTADFEIPGQRPNLKRDLQVVAYALGSRWKLIATIVVIALLAGIVYMWQATPSYRSAVDILVDPRARTVVGMDVVPTGMGSSSQGSDSGLVDSQVQLLQSRAVLTAVIDQLGLDRQAATAKPASLFGPLSSALKALLYGPNHGGYGGTSPADRALADLQSSIKVERIGNTYVLRVTVASADPQQAADIANAIAAIYVKQGQDAVDRETEQTAQALEARLTQLKKTSDDAQQALETYRSDNGLLDTQGLMVDEQQLRELNDQAIKASIDTEAARARLAEIDRLKGLPAASLTGANTLSSPAADAIRTQLDAATAEERSLSGLYGPQHPTLIQAKQRRIALEQALLQESKRIEGRAASDYQTAVNAERAVRTLLAQSEARRSTSNEASIRLRELQTAADTAKSIYDAFSLRAAQTREQINLPTNTARVIAAAEPSSQPSDPRLPIVLAVAGFLGLIGGLLSAWVLYLLGGTPTPSKAVGRPGPETTAQAAKPRRETTEPRHTAIHASARDVPPAPAPGPAIPFGRRRPMAGLFR